MSSLGVKIIIVFFAIIAVVLAITLTTIFEGEPSDLALGLVGLLEDLAHE